MTRDDYDDNASKAPCFKEETMLISGPCPKCGQNLEFFSVPEVRNQKNCPLCNKPFDAKIFAEKIGLSV